MAYVRKTLPKKDARGKKAAAKVVKRVSRLQAAQAALKDAERELARAEKAHRKAVAKRAKAQERLDKHLAPEAVAKKLRSALRIPRVAVQ